MKIKTVKISAGGFMGKSMKICPRETIPLYSRLFIRASVDALCRDDADQISRDPHT